jgi:hypothetical protein
LGALEHQIATLDGQLSELGMVPQHDADCCRAPVVAQHDFAVQRAGEQFLFGLS